MPLFVRVLSHFTGNVKVLPGPYTLGRYGIFMNLIGLAFLLFTSITFNFPTLGPVDRENMNYTSAAIGVIGLISLVVSGIVTMQRTQGQLTKTDVDHDG